MRILSILKWLWQAMIKAEYLKHGIDIDRERKRNENIKNYPYCYDWLCFGSMDSFL